MAGYIAGIEIKFGADVSQLNSALGKFQGKLNKTQNELKQVNRALKFNPANTTLLQQKFKLLQQSIDQTEAKLKGLKSMQARMDSNGVDKNSAAYRSLQREIIKTEDQLKRAQNDLRQFGSVGKQQALAVGNAFKTAGNKIKSAGRTITTSVSVYGMAGIYAGSRLIEMSEKQSQAEQKLAEIYKSRMGVGKQAVKSTLQLASAQQKAGVVGDEVQIAAAQQLATYAKYPNTVNTMLPALNNLLVQQKGLNGTQEDATALANLFGKAMMGQTGALKRAGISFTDAQEEVLKYGTEEEKAAMIAEVVEQNVGNMNAEFAKTDAGKIQQAKNALGDMGEEIGAVLLPAVADLVGWLQENLMPKLEAMINFFKQHPQLATFALALAGITAVLGPLIMILGGFISTIGSIITIMGALGISLGAIALPVTAVVVAIGAAIAIGVALYKNWDTIKAKAAAIWGSIKTKITTLVNTIKTNVTQNFNTLKNTLSNAWNTIKTTATNVWNGIKSAITKPIDTAKQKVKDIIDKIKSFFPLKLKKLVSFSLPKISIGSKTTKVGDKNVKSPTFSVGSWSHYAKAMDQPYMFNKATGIVAGEAGSEILYGRDSLMRDIAKATAGAGNIVINVYGTDGMSVTELANAVQQKLITAQNRRRMAWA